MFRPSVNANFKSMKIQDTSYPIYTAISRGAICECDTLIYFFQLTRLYIVWCALCAVCLQSAATRAAVNAACQRHLASLQAGSVTPNMTEMDLPSLHTQRGGAMPVTDMMVGCMLM